MEILDEYIFRISRIANLYAPIGDLTGDYDVSSRDAAPDRLTFPT